MEDTQDYIEVNGQRWFRQRVTASLRLADARQMPDPLIRSTASKQTDPAYFFMDGVNPDLVYVSFVLDTEGANANWDFMPRGQLLKSYATCRFKPFDANHAVDEGEYTLTDVKRGETPLTLRNTIYGVMTHAALADADGKLLTSAEVKKFKLDDDLDREPKDKVHVVAWAALYNFLFPNTVKELVTAVNDGKMQVSMERWLTDYDFLYWDADKWQVCDRATAEKTEIFRAWSKKLGHAGQPVYRRTLGYIYGGVASTTNPANPLSRFLDQSASIPVKAAASLKSDPLLQKMVAEHDEVHRQFERASEADKPMLIAKHQRIHAAVAAYIGGQV